MPWKKIAEMDPEGPESLQHRLVHLVGRARAVDLRSFERGTLRDVLDELVPETASLLEEAAGLLGDILDRYDVPAAEDEIELGENPTPPSPAEALCDVAFLARSEMRRKLDELRRHSREKDFAHLISLCAGGLRRISKTASAVDAALCDCEGMVQRLTFQTELLASLEIRRAYAKFSSAVRDSPPPTPQTVRNGLQRAGTAIARLLGRDVSRNMRYADRLELRGLQERMLTWCNDPASEPVEGQRLWQDVAGFAELIHEVNRRSELVEHDGEVATHTWKRLFAAEESPETVPDDLRGPLTALFGRRQEIDRLIVFQCWNADAWRAPMTALLTELGAFRQNHERHRETVASPAFPQPNDRSDT